MAPAGIGRRVPSDTQPPNPAKVKDRGPHPPCAHEETGPQHGGLARGHRVGCRWSLSSRWDERESAPLITTRSSQDCPGETRPGVSPSHSKVVGEPGLQRKPKSCHLSPLPQALGAIGWGWRLSAGRLAGEALGRAWGTPPRATQGHGGHASPTAHSVPRARPLLCLVCTFQRAPTVPAGHDASLTLARGEQVAFHKRMCR